MFWLVPYLSLLCQQVGGLESVLLYFDRNLKNWTVLVFFFSCHSLLLALSTVGSQGYFLGDVITEANAYTIQYIHKQNQSYSAVM